MMRDIGQWVEVSPQHLRIDRLSSVDAEFWLTRLIETLAFRSWSGYEVPFLTHATRDLCSYL